MQIMTAEGRFIEIAARGPNGEYVQILYTSNGDVGSAVIPKWVYDSLIRRISRSTAMLLRHQDDPEDLGHDVFREGED
jgi:hypothetical protein